MTRDYTSWVLRTIVTVAVVVLLSPSLALRAIAVERREHGGDGWRGHEVQRWEHGDMGRFHAEELNRWHDGHWWHGEHFGRLGWWWIVADAWYFYPAPVYPYPDPATPPTVVTQEPQYWYYCASVQTYYPYVITCPEGWMQVVPQLPPPEQ